MLPTLLKRTHLDKPLVTIPHDVGDFFEHMFESWRDNASADYETAAYPCDIREENGQIHVDAELPGFKKEEVKVTLEHGVLSINAEHEEEQDKQEDGESYLQERRYRRIQRTFTLPKPVDESKVKANLKDGVLHLTLNKTEASKAREITVQ